MPLIGGVHGSRLTKLCSQCLHKASKSKQNLVNLMYCCLVPVLLCNFCSSFPQERMFFLNFSVCYYLVFAKHVATKNSNVFDFLFFYMKRLKPGAYQWWFLHKLISLILVFYFTFYLIVRKPRFLWPF